MRSRRYTPQFCVLHCKFAPVCFFKQLTCAIERINSDASKPYNYIFPNVQLRQPMINIPSHFNVFGLDKMRF